MQKRKLLEGALRTATVLTLLLRLRAGDWGDVYLCVLSLGLFGLPEWMGQRLGVFLPGALRSMMLGFMFASEILGEIFGWYQAVPCWDLALHTVSGFFFCALGWFLASGGSSGNSQAAFSRILSAVCISVTVGVLWEFFEWGADWLFGLDMQKDTVLHAVRSVRLDPSGGGSAKAIGSIREVLLVCADGESRCLGLGGYLDVGLNDTMGDLLVNSLGALVFAVLAHGRGKAGQWLRERFVPRWSAS